MTIEEARAHYAAVLSLLKKERTYRDKFLSEPRRSQALSEIDAAMAALNALGAVIQTAAAEGILASVPVQGALLDVPPSQPYP